MTNSPSTDRTALPKRQEGKILTSFDYPPIPHRGADWSAVFDGYDGAPDANDIIGRGPTELAAIADLLDKERDRDESVSSATGHTDR